MNIKFPTLSALKKNLIFENKFAKLAVVEIGVAKFIHVTDKKNKNEDQGLFRNNTYTLTGAGYEFARYHFIRITKKYKK